MKLRCGPRRPRRSLALPLGVVLVGWVGAARGQALTVGSSGPDEFHLIATVGVRPNSNVLFESGNSQGDYITTIALGLNARRHSPRTDWSLNYRPILNHYMDFSELDHLSQAFNGGADYSLSPRSKMQIRETFTFSQDPIIVASPETGDSPILTNTQKRWRNLSDIGFARAVSPSISWSTGVTYYANRFEDTNATDNNGILGRLDLNVALGKHDTLTGAYTPGYVSFKSHEPAFDPCDPASTLPTTKTQTIHSTANQLGLGWTHATGRSWQTDLGLGSSLVDQQVRDFTQSCPSDQIDTNDRSRTQRLFVGRAGLRGSFHRFDLIGGAQRRLTADTGADTVTVGNNFFLALNGKIGQQTTYGVALDYTTRKSLGGSTTLVDIASQGVTLRSGYAINDWCSLSAAVSLREQQNSESSANNQIVDNYFFGVSFKVF